MNIDVRTPPLVEQIAAAGHNNPPGPIDGAREAYKALAEFLNSTPAIADADAAKEAKLFLDRTRLTIKDVEAASKAESAPLHEAWKASLAKYKPAIESLSRLLDELSARLTAYARAEEAKRIAEAEAKRLAALEAERLAREAEAKEQEAKENAAAGDCEANAGAAIAEADAAFAAFKKADHQARVAERDASVRIGGGFTRAIGLRTTKTLVLGDAPKALAALSANGVPEKIRDAILSAARAYHKLNGAWPEGVSEHEERKI